jgi:hypothetical protein
MLIRYSDLVAATPDWEVYTKWIEDHAHARTALGALRGDGRSMRIV